LSAPSKVTPGRIQAIPLEDRLAAQHFLLEHLRRGGSPSRLPTPTASDWECIVEEAVRHRIAPLAYRRLADGPWGAMMPDETRERLRSIYVHNAFRNAILLRETAHAVAALAGAGVPTMLLKGVHLAGFVYDEPALRSMADIDLMVPRAKLATAERVFLEQGYGPLPRPDLEEHCAWSNHLPKLEKPDAEVLEVHYAIERPTAPFAIDSDALWARARAVRVGGLQAWALCDEDLLLHLCLHASYHHRFDRYALKGLLDVSTLVDRCADTLDWNDVAATANTWRAGGFVYCTLRLVREILGAQVPPSVLSALTHDAADDEVMAVAERYILTPPVDLPEAVLDMRRHRGLAERLALFVRGVFLPREQLRRMYGLRPGSPLIAGLYVVRLFDLLRRRGGIMLRTLFRAQSVEPTLERENDRQEIERWASRVGARTAA
jgi:hypothetical protein